MRRVNEEREAIEVERAGKPCVAVIAFEEYWRLKPERSLAVRQEALRTIRQPRTEINANRSKTLMGPEK